MDEKFIRQIPKYIEKKIRATDKKSCPAQKGLRFYAYLTTIKKELVKITVAVRNRNKKERLRKWFGWWAAPRTFPLWHTA